MIKQAVIPLPAWEHAFCPLPKFSQKSCSPSLNVLPLEFIIEELAESGIEEVILDFKSRKRSHF